MLQSYYDECQELLKEYEVEFSQDVAFFKKSMSGKQSDTELPTIEPEGDEAIPLSPGLWEKTNDGWEKVKDQHLANDSVKEGKDDAPDWAKKLYKKIALATHPDKVTGHTLEDELIKRFLKAGRSYEDGKYEELVAIALDLNIKIDISDEAMHTTLVHQRDSLKQKITNVESSLAWIWCENYGNADLKSRILSTQLDSAVNIDDLKDMISKKEKQDASR